MGSFCLNVSDIVVYIGKISKANLKEEVKLVPSFPYAHSIFFSQVPWKTLWTSRQNNLKGTRKGFGENLERERGGERLNYFEKISLRRICGKKYIKI